tara:strand:- start:100 stop:816 length:717 start_codon:yes stop_codon:yes gene_type:complete
MDVDTIFKTINQNKYLREINIINVNYNCFSNINKLTIQDLIIKFKTLYESSLKINVINQYNNINDNTIIENKKNIYINENKNLNLKLSEKRNYFFGDKNNKLNLFNNYQKYKRDIRDIYIINTKKNNINNNKNNNDKNINLNNIILKTINIENLNNNTLSNRINDTYIIEYIIYLNNETFIRNKNYISIKEYIDKNNNNNYFSIDLIFEINENDKIITNKLIEIKKIINQVNYIINNQ